jgi:hypothetical protein
LLLRFLSSRPHVVTKSTSLHPAGAIVLTDCAPLRPPDGGHSLRSVVRPLRTTTTTVGSCPGLQTAKSPITRLTSPSQKSELDGMCITPPPSLRATRSNPLPRPSTKAPFDCRRGLSRSDRGMSSRIPALVKMPNTFICPEIF